MRFLSLSESFSSDSYLSDHLKQGAELRYPYEDEDVKDRSAVLSSVEEYARTQCMYVVSSSYCSSVCTTLVMEIPSFTLNFGTSHLLYV